MRTNFAMAALLAAAAGVTNAATVTTVLFEDFEDATVTYTTTPGEFTDGTGDFFTRTDGGNIGSFVNYNDIQGSGYFAVMDIDGDQPVEPVVMEFTNIPIAGLSDLEFSGLFAEDDDGSSQDWDAPDYVHISFQIDGGGYSNLLWFENDGSTFNSEALVDTDFDGTGDGTALTDTFTLFTAAIAGTGSTLDLKIEFQLDSGDEDIALDNITVTGVVPTPGAAAAGLAGFGLILGRRRRA